MYAGPREVATPDATASARVVLQLAARAADHWLDSELFEDALLAHASTRGLTHHCAHDLLYFEIGERVDDVRHGGNLLPSHMVELECSVAHPDPLDRRRPSAPVGRQC